MELKTIFAQDGAGNVIPLPRVHLYLPGGTTPVTGLKNAAGEYLPNPFTGTAGGQIQVAAPDGDYTMRIIGAGRDYSQAVRFIDASENVAAVLAAKQAAEAAARSAGQDAGTAQGAAGTAIAAAGDAMAALAGAEAIAGLSSEVLALMLDPVNTLPVKAATLILPEGETEGDVATGLSAPLTVTRHSGSAEVTFAASGSGIRATTSAALATGASLSAVARAIQNDGRGQLIAVRLVGAAAVLAISGTPPLASEGEPFSWAPTVTGGAGTLTFALGGPALPAGWTFSTATGAIETDEAAEAGTIAGLTITATDSTGSAMLGPFSIMVVPAVTATGPFRDNFSTAGNINGRAGWLVQTRPAFASQIDAITAADGFAGGGASAAYAVHQEDSIVCRVQMIDGPALSNTTQMFHVNLPAVDAERSWLELRYSRLIDDTTGSVSLQRMIGGVSQSPSLANILQYYIGPGDVVESEFSETAGRIYWDGYHNGIRFAGPVDITDAGIPFTNRHGFFGNQPAKWSLYQSGNPSTQAMLRLFQPNKTVPVNADGSATWRVSLEYTHQPAALSATLYDRSTGSDVAVFENRPLENLTSGDGVAAGEVTATAAEIASGGPFYIEIAQPVAAPNNPTVATGPQQGAGLVILTAGQSLAVGAGNQTGTGGTYARPDNCWWLAGAPDSLTVPGTMESRKQYPIGSNSTTAAFAGTLQGITDLPMTLVGGGTGGSNLSDRGAGSATMTVLKENIRRMGGRCNLVRHTDGQNDRNTDPAVYESLLVEMYDDLAEANAGNLRVLLNPVASTWYSSASADATWQAMRRLQWKICQTYPARFFEGANVLDLQHTDTLHLTGGGYGEMCRREAWAAAKALGYAVDDRNGPSLVSVERISATEVRCLYDLHGADSLELANTAYAGEYHGGMVFSTAPTIADGTIASKIYPTGAVVDAAPSGGQQGITFTFPPATFPGAVYAWACYGQDPFNPAQITAIRTDMAGKASMIRAVRAGEPPVGLRPRFTLDGTDYLTAS